MDASNIRRINMRALVKQHGSLEKLADLTGSAPGHLSQINNGTRNMGAAVARRFEARLSLPRGWMDTREHAYPQGTLNTELLVRDFVQLPETLQDYVLRTASELRAIIEAIPEKYRKMISTPPTDPDRYREWEEAMKQLASKLSEKNDH